VDSGWAEAIRRGTAARVVLVIGESDTGKTSFTTALANELLAEGYQVAVVDADLGQSEIGPPTTIGLGRIVTPVERLGQAEVVGLYFVGAISPQASLLPTVTGTKLMVEKAFRLGMDKVLVDTSGLIQGELGRALKHHKIDLLDPDLLICLQRGTECEHILRCYDLGTRPGIVRLTAAVDVRRRSQEARRAHRDAAFRSYFQSAKSLSLDLSRVILQEPALFVGQPLDSKQIEELSVVVEDVVLWAERHGSELTLITPDPLTEAKLRRLVERFEGVAITSYSLNDFPQALAGLENRERETVGLGVVRSLDFAKQIMVIETPVSEADIASIQVGRHKLPPA